MFDFTEFVTPNEQRFNKDLANAFLWTANDLAYIDEKLGVIKPVKYYIEINYIHPAEE
ncbi:MAG: hypothetical protein H6Q74_2181 [Firmicutes bacterium]|nr:hypothetical protein [Bacillota bacterium]